MAQTYNFNNCGSSGRYGPNPGACGYGGNNDVNIVGEGIQEWNVPETGLYRITASGAQGTSHGSNDYGGRGAVVRGDVSLDAGNDLHILVGQMGYSSVSDSNAGGAGGGTFVAREDNTGDSTSWGSDVEPLYVAGGGVGNQGDCTSLVTDLYGNTATYAKDSRDGQQSGGQDGGTGQPGETPSGAGWLEDGKDGTNYAQGGSAFVNGGVGGKHDNEVEANGGFGGGGGAHGNSAAFPGGGGYSGGAGPTEPHTCSEAGSGGASFIAAGVENPATSDGSWDTTGSEPHDVYSGGVSSLNEWGTGHGHVEITQCGANFNNPSVQSTGYSDSQASSSSSASFTTNVDVDVDSSANDPCEGTVSGNTLSSCSVTVTGEDGNSYEPSASVSGDTCEFTVENNAVSAWGPGEEVTLDINVTDDQGLTDSLTDTYSFVDTDVDEISVNSPSDNADGVFGFDSGVDLEFSVTDYEAKTTNKDLSVDIRDDSLQNIGTQTVSGGDGTVSVEWERDGEYGDTGMYGFKRGNSYDWNVDVAYASSDTDIGGNSGDPWTFTVENPPNVNGLTPTDGAQSSGLSVQELQNTISVNQMEVEFYLGSLGTSSYNIEGTDTVLGSSGAASTNIMDAVQSGDEYEWFIGVDDGHSYTKYDSRVNTFTAPEVLRTATDLYVLPTERPSRDALNSLGSGDESYIWVDNGKLHWVDPATGTERWLQFAQSLSETTIPSGAIWVDGENLVWVGEDTTRYQHVGTNDGSSSLDPGTFWVDSSGYLRYVDGNGNERVMNG